MFCADPGTNIAGGTTNGGRSARPRQVRIETVEYQVRPKGVKSSITYDEYGGPSENVFLGTNGWQIEEAKTRILSTSTVTIEKTNQVVPLYDISVQKVKSAPLWLPASR